MVSDIMPWVAWATGLTIYDENRNKQDVLSTAHYAKPGQTGLGRKFLCGLRVDANKVVYLEEAPEPGNVCPICAKRKGATNVR
jgi:hypothetical protein